MLPEVIFNLRFLGQKRDTHGSREAPWEAAGLVQARCDGGQDEAAGHGWGKAQGMKYSEEAE